MLLRQSVLRWFPLPRSGQQGVVVKSWPNRLEYFFCIPSMRVGDRFFRPLFAVGFFQVGVTVEDLLVAVHQGARLPVIDATFASSGVDRRLQAMDQ